MKLHNFFTTMMSTALAVGLVLSASTVTADDGQRLVRSVSSSPGTVADPEPEGEHAFIKLMNFHVPSQSAEGALVPVEYYDIDDVLVKTEEKAKPLVNVFVYGPVIGFEEPEASGFAGHGRREAYGAISLDDGETWKATNLSGSAELSSFEVTTPLQDPGASTSDVLDYDPDGPVIEEAIFTDKANSDTLDVLGSTGLDKRNQVDIRNAVTQELLFTVRADYDGVFDYERRVEQAPCLVQAGVNGVFGPAADVVDAPEDCVGPDTGSTETLITDYPGDVPNVFHAVAGNRIMVAWHSKFCQQGSPSYALSDDSADMQADYLGIDNETDFYIGDLFGAGGDQGSTNYNDLGNEPVGEVPYSCLWSARGILRENPEAEGTTQVVWLQSERLTSGVRDVNRVETACVAGAGCAITWQEDPEGVRPGEGEGPGTGWSGATTASKTDIWYSFIEWEDMDLIVQGDNPTVDDIVPLGDTVLDTGRPHVGINMMTPVRLTNNDRCKFPVDPVDGSYCNDAIAGAYGIIDQCVGSVEIPLGPQGTLTPICVVDSNDSTEIDAGDMPNTANTAASRPRLNMQPRDSDGDGIVDDAWVVVVSEEDKGLGRFGFLNDQEWTLGNLDDTGTPCELPEDESEETNCQKADQGKDVFWASFNLGSPATSEGVGVDYSLVSNVLVQGAQLNQPEVNWRTGVYYPPMDTVDMWDFGDLNYQIFNTEIARRTSMMSQSLVKAMNGSGDNGYLVAMPLWKQGVVNQGGPADISTRRIVVREGDPAIPSDECPIEVVDEDGPYVISAKLNQNDPPKIAVTGDGLDTDAETRGHIRNAVTGETVFKFNSDDEPEFSPTKLPDDEGVYPCAIQVEDNGAGNWGPFFKVENAPEDCSGPLPEECLNGAVSSTDEPAQMASENPYSPDYIECKWYDGEGGEFDGVEYFTDGSNPYYPHGLCMAAPINLSARTPYVCEASGVESDGLCPGVSDMTCEEDATFGQLCSSTNDPDDSAVYDKMLSWYECPGWNGTNISGDAAQNPAACGVEPDSELIGANLDDQSWYNPLEVSKAHRGFLDGDHIMMQYAWSPNYKLNTVGHDRYELYTRRSFDGGVTWTTTPDSFTASDGVTYIGSGTTTCETMRDGETSQDDTHMCTEYAAGDPEQSRNVSQLKSMANTILDPRYTPTIASMPTEGDLDWGIFEAIVPTDVRNPSRNFVVFEDGDNTTVEAGEAEPLNLAYGRAEMFGDHFTVWAETDTGSANIDLCYPNDAHDDPDVAWAVGTGFCHEFDTLEGFQDALSEEASITASAYGDFLYGVWGQFNVDLEHDNEFIDGDSMFRRIWYIDDYISTEHAWTLPGTQQ